MAKTYQAPYTQNPKSPAIVMTTAITARDGSVAPSAYATIGSDGGFIKRITFIQSNATAGAGAAKVGLVFYSIDAGATWKFRAEVAIATATNSTTAIGQNAVIAFSDGWVLPASALVGTGITVRGSAVDDTTAIIEYSDY